ncbi:hypothetical protein [Bradyrhizobium liaoningense]
MGALIPIGGGADAEITGRLNTAFNDTNLGIVRGVHRSEKIFDSRHKLHRIAYRLGTYPTKTYPQNAKGKWFYFLKKILKDATHNNRSTSESIKSILTYAVRTTRVKRVVFDARQGTNPNLDHYVDPNNPMTDGEIANMVDTAGTLLVALICPASLPNTTAPTPNQTGDLDRDQNGDIIERPPIKIFEPQNLVPPSLSKTTRQPKERKKVKRATKAKTTKKSD